MDGVRDRGFCLWNHAKKFPFFNKQPLNSDQVIHFKDVHRWLCCSISFDWNCFRKSGCAPWCSCFYCAFNCLCTAYCKSNNNLAAGGKLNSKRNWTEIFYPTESRQSIIPFPMQFSVCVSLCVCVCAYILLCKLEPCCAMLLQDCDWKVTFQSLGG